MTHTIILAILFALSLIYCIVKGFSKKNLEGRDAEFKKYYREKYLFEGLFFFSLLLTQLQKLFPQCDWL